MREFEWIARYFAPLAGEHRPFFDDDAALLKPSDGCELVVTTDTLNAGVHFWPETRPERVAQKALRVNLSDLAAMGAKPVGYTLNLALPEHTGDTFLQAFADGLASDQARYGLFLLGGDTTRTQGELSITITAFGETPIGQAVHRCGASPGDIIYVTGTIGDATLGLKRVSEAMIERLELPEPRLAWGLALQSLASAMIDLSDGLLQDLQHICEASRAGAKILSSNVPLSEDARAWLQNEGDIRPLLAGGDDYELLFTLPRARREALLKEAHAQPVAITPIGEIMKDSACVLLDADGKALEINQKGWQHF